MQITARGASVGALVTKEPDCFWLETPAPSGLGVRGWSPPQPAGRCGSGAWARGAGRCLDQARTRPTAPRWAGTYTWVTTKRNEVQQEA